MLTDPCRASLERLKLLTEDELQSRAVTMHGYEATLIVVVLRDSSSLFFSYGERRIK
ncbi:MAG TPA: hypothetical protein VFN35_31875 [Ktedonobacteraceae bacterium]|nr:hypothetical protein [Ktedonobacteraceae bacterium]